MLLQGKAPTNIRILKFSVRKNRTILCDFPPLCSVKFTVNTGYMLPIIFTLNSAVPVADMTPGCQHTHLGRLPAVM